MAERNDGSETLGVSADVFESVALGVMRAHVLMLRGANGEPTNIGAAPDMEHEATRLAQQVVRLLNDTAGPLKKEIAQELGWPSTDALVAYLFSGPSVGGAH